MSNVDIVELQPRRYRHAFVEAEPEVRVTPGTIVRVATLDAQGRDGAGRQRAAAGNPLCGPIHVDGAMPGDALVVALRELRLQGRAGFSAGAIAPHLLSASTPSADGVALVDWVLVGDCDGARMAPSSGALARLALSIEPMLGCLGVAGASESAGSSIRAGPHGGNLDYRGVRAGAVVLLPVIYPGGLVYLGDGHARQGDGEAAGTGIEVPLEVEMRLDVLKGEGLAAPRGVTATDVFTIGTGRSLDAALRAALDELVAWLRAAPPSEAEPPHQMEPSLDEEAIALVVGQALAIDVANAFNPDYAVACRLPRAVLPIGFAAGFAAHLPSADAACCDGHVPGNDAAP